MTVIDVYTKAKNDLVDRANAIFTIAKSVADSFDGG